MASEIVPPGEGPGQPLSIRYPKKLLEEIDAVAKETRNSRTDTIMHLLRWACAERRRQLAAEAAKK